MGTFESKEQLKPNIDGMLGSLEKNTEGLFNIEEKFSSLDDEKIHYLTELLDNKLLKQDILV